MNKLKIRLHSLLRWSEKYFKTDMVYLARGSFWLSLSQIISAITAFILSVAFARILPKDVFGHYQFALSVASIIGALTLTGMNTAVTHATARGYEGVLTRSVRIQIAWGTLPFLIGTSGAVYYFLHDNTEISLSILGIAILLPLLNSFNTYGSFLIGKKDFRRYFIYNQVISIIYTTVMVLSILFVKKAVVLVLVNFIVNTIITYMTYRTIVKRVVSNDLTENEAIAYGKNLSFANILPLIALQADNIVVFHYLGAVNLAIYAFASTIPERLGGIIKTIATTALPKFSIKTHDNLRQSILRRTAQLTTLAAVGALTYILFARPLFKIFFPQYIASVSYSYAYAGVVVLSIASSLPIAALLSLRNQKRLYVFNTLNPVFNISFLVILGQMYGIWGVIIGKALGNACATLLSYALVVYKKPALNTATNS